MGRCKRERERERETGKPQEGSVLEPERNGAGRRRLGSIGEGVPTRKGGSVKKTGRQPDRDSPSHREGVK
jgi:hypothetical protein